MRLTGAVAVMLAMLAGCASTPQESEEPVQDAAAANLQLGTAYASNRRFDVALDKLKKALSFKEDSPEAHNAIAVVYEETGQLDLAETHFKRAMELDANFTLARLNYGQYLCTHGKAAEGEALLQAIAENPPNGSVDDAHQAYTAAAACALAVSDRQRADAYLRQAAGIKPNDPLTLFRLADNNYASGDYLKARAFLQRYHAQAGYNPESLWLGLSIEEKLGDTSLYKQYKDILLSQFADSEAAKRLNSPQ